MCVSSSWVAPAYLICLGEQPLHLKYGVRCVACPIWGRVGRTEGFDDGHVPQLTGGLCGEMGKRGKGLARTPIFNVTLYGRVGDAAPCECA